MKSTQRPQPAYPLVKSHPPSSSSMTDSMTRKEADSDPQAFTGYKLVSTSCNGIPVQRTERKGYGLDSANLGGDLRSRGTSTVPTRPPSMALSHLHPEKFDLFKVDCAPHTAPQSTSLTNVPVDGKCARPALGGTAKYGPTPRAEDCTYWPTP